MNVRTALLAFAAAAAFLGAAIVGVPSTPNRTSEAFTWLPGAH